MKHLRQYISQLIMEQVETQLIGAIYCDMDGVLVDFVTGAIQLINRELEAAAAPGWTSARKSVRSSVRRIHRDLGPEYRVNPGDDLRVEKGISNLSYAVVGRDPGEFFRGLPPFEDGINELWSYLNSLGVPVHILSAPIGGEGPGGTAADGKRDWVKRLSPPPTSVIIAAAVDKQAYAVDETTGKPNVLIDDKESTVIEWNNQHVGFEQRFGILHEPGNSMSTIQTLKGLGL